jgi:hypothetical protein
MDHGTESGLGNVSLPGLDVSHIDRILRTDQLAYPTALAEGSFNLKISDSTKPAGILADPALNALFFIYECPLDAIELPPFQDLGLEDEVQVGCVHIAIGKDCFSSGESCQ